MAARNRTRIHSLGILERAAWRNDVTIVDLDFFELDFRLHELKCPMQSTYLRLPHSVGPCTKVVFREQEINNFTLQVLRWRREDVSDNHELPTSTYC